MLKLVRLLITFVGALIAVHSRVCGQETWQTTFIDKPNFAGRKLPPLYSGKSTEEILGYTALNINMTLPAMTPGNFRWIDSTDTDTLGDIPSNVSSELRGHPLLDKLVLELNQDPIALASYVQNEISLTNTIQDTTADTIKASQILRGALGTYLEKQGSPWEQCALLVHLLRRAGYPAAYVYNSQITESRGLWMPARNLNAMLGILLQENPHEQDFIRLDFPWVAVYTTKTGTGGTWKQIFPWIKDTMVEEGLDHYDYLPAGYASGKDWMQKYLTNDPVINALIAPGGRDTPGSLFIKHLDATAAHAGLSAEDFGLRQYNRKKAYYTWDGFPQPTVIGKLDDPVWTGTLSVKANDLKDAADATKFATLKINIRTTAGTNRITTQAMRLCDLHNRRLYTFQKPGTNIIALALSPFNEDATLTAGNFSSTTVIAQQYREATITTAPLEIQVDIAGLASSIDFSGVEFTRPLSRNSLTSICFTAGGVTSEMLDIHTRKFDKLKTQGTVPLQQDIAGVNMSLVGMTYWKDALHERRQIRDIHKIYDRLNFGVCLASITVGSGQNSTQWRIPRVDIPFTEIHFLNGSIRPRSTQTVGQVWKDFCFLALGIASANEHHVLNSFFGSENAISTVKLLRLANARHAANAGNYNQGFYSFTRDEFAAAHNNPTFASVKAEAGGLWTTAYNELKIGVAGHIPTGWEMIYITPFNIAMDTSAGLPPAYNGMGLLYLSLPKSGALIDEGANGGVGSELSNDIFSGPNFSNLSMSLNLDGSPELIDFSSLNLNLFIPSITTLDIGIYLDNITSGNLFIDPLSAHAWTAGNEQLGFGTTPDLGTLGETLYSNGWLGPTSWHHLGGVGNSFVSDPVNVINGEFYIDTVDLTLPGPFPLEIRRNYGSHNQALNSLGYGWKFTLTPYISATQNEEVIYAAEPDGSVVAYRKVPSSNPQRWEPTAADNPLLNNFNGGSIGGHTNPFNAHILKTIETTNTIYTLHKPDGKSARYRVRAFPFTSGGVTITRQRPYLERWSDSFGNYFTFSYYESASDVEYGQLRRIVSTNGSYLGFRYNASGLATEIFTHDGRRVSYRYDSYGDLIEVTLPDGAIIAYEYKISLDPDRDNSPYSTHLLSVERKPDGRVLKNVYDPIYDPKSSTYSGVNFRRIKEQWGTVGVDLVPIKFAEFDYNPAGDPWVGAGFDVTYVHSDVRPAKGRLTTTYVHKNGAYHHIADATAIGFSPSNTAMDHVISNVWYTAGEPNGYPRSVKSIKDKRGLTTFYEYDAKGSLKKLTKRGDLIGDGSETNATTHFYYDLTRHVLQKTIDTAPSPGMAQRVIYYTYPTIPNGGNSAPDATNSGYYLYGRLPQKITTYAVVNPVLSDIEPSASDKISETINYYGKEISGTIESHGLVKKTTTSSPVNGNDKTETTWTHAAMGHPLSRTQKTFATSADVTTTYAFNTRGELAKETDPSGRNWSYEYDPMGRMITKTLRSPNSAASPVDWHLSYYNQNGEATWEDGMLHNPEDYVFRDYDGAGRLIAEARWRSQASIVDNGLFTTYGVEEVPDQDHFLGQSITYFEYDGFGNLVSQTNPLGVSSHFLYDALGQLVSLTHAKGTSEEAKESFGYEPGGLVREHVNTGGGITTSLFSDNGLVAQRTTPDNKVEKWRYFLDGRVKEHILSNGAVWTYSYDDKLLKETRVLTKSLATIAKEIRTFDTRGNETSIEVFSGASTSYIFNTTYDGLGRIISKSGPPSKVHPTTLEAVSSQQTSTHKYTYSPTVPYFTSEVTTGTVKEISTYDVRDLISNRSRINTNTSTIEDEWTYFHDRSSISTNRVLNRPDGTKISTLPAGHIMDYAGNVVMVRIADNTTCKRIYDKANNLLSSFDEIGLETKYTYDARNRVRLIAKPDGSQVALSYDNAANLICRVMPGGIRWEAGYDQAGRLVWEHLKGTNSEISRRTEFDYFTSGDNIGLLSSIRENPGRSDAITHTLSYDGAMRVTSVRSAGGGYPEILISRAFDWRGTITDVIRSSPTHPGLIPTVRVASQRDGYDQIFDQITQIGTGQTPVNFAPTSTESHLIQHWDSTGLRKTLRRGPSIALKGTWNPWFTFSHFASGHLKQTHLNSSLESPGWSMDHTWGSNGILSQNILSVYTPTSSYQSKKTNTTSPGWANNRHDALGRLVSREIVASANGTSSAVLTETFPRAGDGNILNYTVQRTAGTGGSWANYVETKTFDYHPLSRRLTSETYKPAPESSAVVKTLSYSTDSDLIGVRTKVDNVTDNSIIWQAPPTDGLDAFKRLAQESERSEFLSFLATGMAVGPGNFNLRIGKGAAPSSWEDLGTVIPKPGYGNGSWSIPLTLPPGQYTLKASATPVWTGSSYAAEQSRTFTVGTGTQQRSRVNTYDGSGRLISRSWAGGQVVQRFTWDATGRLIQVTQVDSRTTGKEYGGYVWTAIYDPFGRRISTSFTPESSGAFNPERNVVKSWYDPQVEFLEIAVETGNKRWWKVYGPDLTQDYGAMQGVGGLEVVVDESTEKFYPILDDAFGNIVAYMDVGVVSNGSDDQLIWLDTQVSGYGPLPGHRMRPLEHTKDILKSLVWQSRRIDPTGLFHMGARYYDPVAGAFISPDPLGHAECMDLYSYANGDPINRNDPTGRGSDALANNQASINPISAGAEAFANSLLLPTYGPTLEGQYAGGLFWNARGNQWETLEQYRANGGHIQPLVQADRDVMTPLNLGMAIAPVGFATNALWRLGIWGGGWGLVASGEEEAGAGLLLSGAYPISRTPANGGASFFRGTSQGYPGSPGLQQIGVTPASTDPAIATLFAIESSNYGAGVVYVASPSALRSVTVGPGNVLSALEREVGIMMSPAEFAATAQAIPLSRSISALEGLGIRLPANIADKAALDAALRSTTPMTPSQINAYLEAVR